jgi:hypothetical protein
MAKHIGLPAAILIAALSSTGWCQEKQQIVMSSEGVKSRYVQQQAIDVDDLAGHQVRVQETHREYPADKQLVVEGERVVESWVRGFSNYVNGIGPASGYATWVTDKGSKIFVEYSGASESQATDTGSRRGTYHGTARIVGGTGKFAKIRGLLVDTTKFDTDPKSGYNVSDSRGDYWFEQ